MEWMNLMLALALPLFLGGLLVDRVMPGAFPGRTSVVWGNGMLAGLLLVPLLIRLTDSTGAALSFSTIALIVAALIVLLASARRWCIARGSGQPLAEPANQRLSAPQKLLLVLLVLLIVLRLVTLGLELLWRPLFPWDATMHWATKAKVWFDSKSLVPFVENEQWLELGGAGVFTDHHPGYPVTTPLLQTWVSLSLGRWDESLINLPWLLCCLGLLAAFYGQARAAGSTVLTATVFTYMLLSMPLLGTHVALAGYADLFLGAVYCAAIMAFHNWSLGRGRGQAMVAIFFALCCPLIKNEGLFWLLTFIPGVIVVLLPVRRALTLLAAGVVVLALALLLVPQDLAVAGHSLADLNLRYRPGALAGIATSILIQDNWHLLGYLLVGLTPLVLVLRKSASGKLAVVAATLLSAMVLFLFLFLCTRYSRGAMHFTAVGRISLHLIPALTFFCLLLWNELVARTPVPPTVEAAAPMPANQSGR